MASRTSSAVLVESDFLFGLRDSDSHHAHVLKALDMHKGGAIVISVLSSSVIEVQAVLHSRGLRNDVIEDALSLMDIILAQYGIRRFVSLELSDTVLSERLRQDYRGLGFFDSLHAAASHRLGIRLLSSEGIYESLGLQVIDLDEL